MRFAAQIWLYLVPLLPAAWLLLRLGDRRARRRLTALLGARSAAHVEGGNPRLRGWRRFLLLSGVFWLLLALARPQWGASEVAVTERASDIVVALDISNSMLAEDVPPNRMERAKAELTAFLRRLEGSRVGLVFFAGSAFVQCPLTLDYGTAEIFLQMADPDMLSEQGTALGAALDASRALLAKGREGAPGGTFQAILLVTDGEDLEGKWEEAARACARDNIRIIPVGVGQEEGGLIPVQDANGRPAGFLKDDDGNVVLTRLDLESLSRLAATGGGSAFRIGVDGLAGDRLFAELERMGKRDLQERRISAYKERYVWPLLLAMLCLAGTMVLEPRRRAVGAAAVVLLLAAAMNPGAASAGLRPAGAGHLEAGRSRYLEGRYDDALHELESAVVAAPDDPLVSLAMGETLFR
ncbi:MAG TPA: VWA domain-containing protein, partial [Candidatus Krumholzibacteria bacterium]|nr:VWA domain-containing protein [Candidatus Krumholzibacteria bacterium]